MKLNALNLGVENESDSELVKYVHEWVKFCDLDDNILTTLLLKLRLVSRSNPM